MEEKRPGPKAEAEGASGALSRTHRGMAACDSSCSTAEKSGIRAKKEDAMDKPNDNPLRTLELGPIRPLIDAQERAVREQLDAAEAHMERAMEAVRAARAAMGAGTR